MRTLGSPSLSYSLAARSRRRTRVLYLLTSGLCLSLLLVPGWMLTCAQVETGKIVGTVQDGEGAVVPEAAVTVLNTATGAESHTLSTTGGEFVVPQLQPGSYSVSVEHAGFKKAQQRPFQLNINQVVNIKIALQVGAVNETVLVTSAEPLLESQTSSIGQVIEGKSIRDLPLNGRNFIELAYLTPGVNAGPPGIVQQGAIPENERGTGAVQANGLTATNNNFLLNGFDNNEQQIGFEVIQPPIDAIQEFKVQTNGFGADIGKGGAVVNVVLKSGTNQFHGNVYEFLRNSAFDAKNFFDDPSLPIPPFKQNQFGGTFGGPLKKNKIFFFADYQGTRIRQSLTDISTVPPLSERNGDFSVLLTGQIDPVTGYDTGQIFDPLTYDPITGTRQPFAGNQIPLKRLDPAALKVVNLFPAPNRSGPNNYLLNPSFRNDQDQFDLRGDAQLTAADNLSIFFSYGNVNAHRPDPFPGIAGGGTFSGDIQNLARAAGITEVYVFSPSRVNEIKVGYFRYAVQATQNFSGQALADQLGIPGINDPTNLQSTGGFPNISIAGLSPLGNQDFFPELLRENNYQLVDSFTYTRGSHSFKFGGDLRRRQHGFYQPQNARGDFSFDQQFTNSLQSGAGQIPFGGSSLASFLLGFPISAFRDGQKGSYGMSWWEFSAYAMDDYRVTPKLTLNLGIRYDIYTPQVEQHDRLANFNFATGQFVSPQMPGVSRSGNVVTDFNNVAPRVGFAYTPGNGNLAFRGGFGIFYDLQADQSDAELAFNPTGLIFSQSFQYAPTTPGIQLSSGFPPPEYPTVQNPFGRASAAYFNNRTSYIEEWNFNMEKQLPANSVLQLAYVGTHGVKLKFLSNQNQPALPLDSNFGPAPNYGRPYFNTVPNISSIRTESNESNLIAHALEVRLEKRFSKRWSLLTAYTWQHTIGQSEEDEYNEPQNTHDLKAERGDNGPDYRNQFTSALTFVPPFGKDQPFLNHGIARSIAGDWQIQSLVELYSGAAFTPMLSFDPTNTGSGAPRPDIVGNPYDFHNAVDFGCPSNRQSITCWYNPLAFATPGLVPGQTFASNFGDARRGTLRGPSNYNVDFSLFKNFLFRETWNVELRAEAFNLFNTPQFGLPDHNTDSSTAGSISSTTHSSRQLQLAIKLSF